MSKQRSTRRPRKQTANRPTNGDGDPHEERSAEAITIAWTASVTGVFLADLVTIAAHFYARSNPESKTAPPFEAIMLLTACVMGLASLALLPIVWRVSRLKPPLGIVVFATLVAAAPIVVTLARLVGP